MFEVKLKNLSNVVSWEARFPTYQEALVWTQKQLPKEGRLQGDPDDFIEDISASYTLANEKIEAQKYLDSTDWYITRLVERQVAVPEEVTALRLAAVAKLNE